jgi:hypothetical protein
MANSGIKFIHPTAAPPKPPSRWRIFIQVFSQVWTLALVFVAVIVISAVLYDVGTHYGWGIQPTFLTNSPPAKVEVSFVECLHFSVVTIATLGYGDYRPESYGRLVSAVEVLTGIILMGIFVARLVSHQQDRLTKRLVRGQLNSEIQEFRDQLAVLLQDFSKTPPVLTSQEPCPLLYRARGLTRSIARFWRHEAMEPYMSEVVPSRAAGRLLGELIDVLKAVIAAVGTRQKNEIHWEDFKAVRGIAESTLVVSTCLTDLIDDHGIQYSHQCVNELIKPLHKQLKLRSREVSR